MDLQNDLRPCGTDKSTVEFYNDDKRATNALWLLPLLWRARYRENITKSYKIIIIIQKQNGYQYLQYCLFHYILISLKTSSMPFNQRKDTKLEYLTAIQQLNGSCSISLGLNQ